MSTELESLGLGETLLSQDTDTRLQPNAPPSNDPFDLLPTVSLHGGLELGELLGEGGMGTVHLARQAALGRPVALKRPKGGSASAEHIVREALITGALEHPNVIPVHMLCRDEHGSPVLVMKKIDGTHWHGILNQKQRPLDWHLDVLMQVASAAHFAHQKQIIHRDIKPANVMIGPFGEVYLLDWGIAHLIDRTGEQDSQPHGPAGTPTYMAPEMVIGDPSGLTERTDVFLLGATLHEVLTGEPPNQGATIGEVLVAAMHPAPPSYAADVPSQLGEICVRAMSADPQKRYASAEEFREAIARYLRLRHSLTVSNSARERMEELASLATHAEADPAKLTQLYGECRFGFEQALRMADDNDDALRGREELLHLMFEVELSRRNTKSAAGILSELRDPPPGLKDRLAALAYQLELEAKETARLATLEQELDPRAGGRVRAGVALALAAGVILFGVISLELVGTIGDESTIVARLIVLALALAVGYGARSRLFPNEGSRRLGRGALVAIVALAFHRLSTFPFNPPIELVLTTDLTLIAVCAATVGVTLDRRILWAAAWLAAASIAAALYQRYILQIYVGAQLVTAGILVLVWLDAAATGRDPTKTPR